MADTYKRKVVKIIDGDTFEIDKAIEGLKRVRVANCNTPERKQDGYEYMSRFLKKQIMGKRVKLTIKQKNPPKGHFQGRWVCYVNYGLLYAKDLTEIINEEFKKKPWLKLWNKMVDKVDKEFDT
ncbi:MAG: hypothetical protein INQ03_15635 [Candidatus Heimdallarchaeota archaeon]|nr:hypothetical protein [Candidatus Heimdallarchaeota archaeon]